VGAERSPFTDIIFQWTLRRYFSSWSVGTGYPFIYFASP